MFHLIQKLMEKNNQCLQPITTHTSIQNTHIPPTTLVYIQMLDIYHIPYTATMNSFLFPMKKTSKDRLYVHIHNLQYTVPMET
jgi:hypothetical protein